MLHLNYVQLDFKRGWLVSTSTEGKGAPPVTCCDWCLRIVVMLVNVQLNNQLIYLTALLSAKNTELLSSTITGTNYSRCGGPGDQKKHLSHPSHRGFEYQAAERRPAKHVGQNTVILWINHSLYKIGMN